MTESDNVVVLFIDDDPSNIEAAKNSVEARFPNEVRCVVKTFETAPQALTEDKPDVLVLDLVEGGIHQDPSTDCSGNKTYRHYWDTRFCPVVVYSAFPDRFAPTQEHPLVTRVQKGLGSPAKLCDEIARLLPQVREIRKREDEIKRHFDQAAHLALRDVFPFALKQFEPSSDDAWQVVLRCARRRLAVLMDDVRWAEDCVMHWEQYIVPPVADSPRLGDLLRIRESAGNTPADFRLVLSPSCDMATGSGRKAKISKILVAQCCSNQMGFNELNMSPKPKEEKLKSMLRRGYQEAHVFLPEFPGRIPSMMADMRRLDLLPINDVGDGKAFEIIASVDSPFRELISWAYLQTTGRPGLPERDFSKWAKEVLARCQENKESTAE